MTTFEQKITLLKNKFLCSTAMALVLVGTPLAGHSAARHEEAMRAALEDQFLAGKRVGTKRIERHVVTEVGRVDNLVVVMPSPQKAAADGLQAIFNKEALERELEALKRKEQEARAANDQKALDLLEKSRTAEEAYLRLQQELQALRREEKALEAGQRKSEEEVSRYHQKFLEKGAKALNLGTMLEVREKELAKKRECLSDLEAQLSGLTKSQKRDQATLQSLTSSIRQQREAVDKAEQELLKLKAEREGLIKERDSFQAQRNAASRDAQKKGSALRDLGSKLRESKTRHQEADKALRQAKAKVADLEAELEGDQRRILELEGKLQGANAQLSAILGALRDEEPDCFDGVDDPVAALDALRLQAILKQVFAGKDAKLHAAMDARDALDAELQALKVTHQELADKLAGAVQTGADKARVIERLETDLATARSRIAELEARADELEAESTALRAERDKFEWQVLALQATEKRLERELTAAKANSDRQAAQVALLTSEKEALEKRQSVLETAIEQLKAAKIQMQQEARFDAQAHQNEAQRQQAAHAQMVRELRETIEAHQQEIARSKDALAERQRVLAEELATAKAEHNQAVAEHNERIAEKEAALAELQVAESQQLEEYAALRKEIEARDKALLEQEKKLRQTSAALAEAERVCMEAKERADAYEKRIEALELEQHQLTERLSKTEERRAAAETQAAEVKARLQALEQVQHTTMEEKEALEARLAEKAGIQSAAGDEAARLEAYEQLTKELSTLEAALYEKVQEAAQQSEALAALTAEHTAVKMKLEQAASAARALQAELGGKQQSLKALEASSEEIRAKHDRLSEENIDIKVKLRELSNSKRAEQEAAAHQQTVEELNLKLDANKSQLKQLEDQLAENQAAAVKAEEERKRSLTQIEAENSVRQALEAKVAEITQALEAARTAATKASEARQLSVAEVEALQEKLRSKAKEMEAATQKALLEQQALRATIDKLKMGAAETSGQIAHLTDALAQAEKEKDEAVAKHAELTADHETATADLAEVRAEKTQLTAALEEKKAAYLAKIAEESRLRQQVDALALESAGLRETVEEMKGQLAEFQKKAELAANELSATQEVIAEREAENKRLERAHAALVAQLAKIQAEREAEYKGILNYLGIEGAGVSKHLRLLKGEFERLQTANDRLEDAVRAAQTARDAVAHQLESAIEQKEKASAKVGKLIALVVEKDDQLDYQETRIRKAERDLQAAEEERRAAVIAQIDLTEQVEQLERSLDQQQRLRMELEEKIRELEQAQDEHLSKSTRDESEIRRLTLSKRKSERLLGQHMAEYELDYKAFEALAADLDAKKRVATELDEALKEERAGCQRLKDAVDAQSALLAEAAAKGMEALQEKNKAELACAEALAQYEDAQAKVRRMEAEIQSLKAALELLPQQVAAQKARNVELQATIDATRAEAEAANRDLEQRTAAFEKLRTAAAKDAKALAALRQQHQETLEKQALYEKQKKNESKERNASAVAYKLKIKLRAKEEEAEILQQERDALQKAFAQTGGAIGISETHDAFSKSALDMTLQTPMRDSGIGGSSTPQVRTGMTPALRRVAAGLKGKKRITEAEMSSLMAQLLAATGVTVDTNADEMMDAYRAGSPVKGAKHTLADHTNLGSPGVPASPFGTKLRTRKLLTGGNPRLRSDIFG